MNEKLAVIMSGGGMKSSFGAGVILALAEKYDVTEPFLLICGSGSAGTGSYYLAKQHESIRNIWTNLVSSKNFIDCKRFWKMMDIDYLIDVIFKKQDPLKEELVRESKTRYLISALNKKTGKVHYFDNRNGMDVFESMRAAKSFPIISGINPSIKIEGLVYRDSLVSSKAENHIEKAVAMGANKILIINNDFSRMNIKMSGHQIPKNISLFTICPKNKIKITNLNNRRELLQQTVEQGYRETVLNDELKLFLNS